MKSLYGIIFFILALVIQVQVPAYADTSYFCITIGTNSCPTSVPIGVSSPTPTPAPTVAPTTAPTATPAPGSTPSVNGQLSAPNGYPNSAYKPYATNSIWNTPITTATLQSGSAAAMAYYTSSFPFLAGMQTGYTNRTNQYQHPIYFGQASDPLYTVTCTASYATCASQIGSTTFHMPSYALQAGGGDAHMTSIDQTTNKEFDFYGVTSINNSTHVVTAGTASISDITGPGIVNSAYVGQTAVGFNNWAGVIRDQEFVANSVNHALFMVMPCYKDVPSIAPGNYRDHPEIVCPGGNGVAYGSRFRLNMTHAQIDAATPTSSYKRGVLYALADYGGYAGDGNNMSGTNIQVEADEMYTTAGYTNANCPTNGAPCTPLTAYLHTLGDPNYGGGRYTISFSEIDWATYGQWIQYP